MRTQPPTADPFRPGRRGQRSRGIALILALFTTAILIILSVSFLALALGESRTSQSAGNERAAIQAANWGIRFAINYMGRGGSIPTSTAPDNTATVWRSYSDPLSGVVGSFDILSTGVWPPSHNCYGYPVQVVDCSTATFQDTPITAPPPPFSTTSGAVLLPVSRAIRIVGRQDGPLAFIQLGNNLQFTCQITVVPFLSRGNTTYRLISTAEVFPIKAAGSTPLARRVLEARIIPQGVASYLHYLSNARSNNAQGHAAGDAPFNSIEWQRDRDGLADFALIPPNYQENGPMRIDGQAFNSTTNATNNFVRDFRTPDLNPLAGMLRFAAGTSTCTTIFNQQLTINGLANVYDDPTQDDTKSGFFNKGGISTGAAHMGLPDFANATKEMLNAATNASLSGAGLAQAKVSIDSGMIMGDSGRSIPPQYLPPQKFSGGANGTADAAYNDPFVSGYTTSGGQTYPKGVDYRPRIPNVEATVQNGTVTLANVSTLDGTVFSKQTYNVGNIQGNVVYVQGGNLAVKQSQNVTGQVTFAAVQRDGPGQRENGASTYASSANVAYNTTTATDDTIYAQAAAEMYNIEQQRAELIRTGVDASTNGTADRYSHIKTPPYSPQDMQAEKTALATGFFPDGTPLVNPINPQTGRPYIDTGNAMIHEIPANVDKVNRKFFPPPDSDLTPNVNREGNVGVTGNITYADRSANLGFVAQNFILLNDNNPTAHTGASGTDAANHTFTLDGVFMSGQRSLQLDWDNTLRQNPTSWQQQLNNGYGGNMTLLGSIVGQYVDVEGDLQGRGFPNQNFQYNQQLRTNLPPFFPHFDFSQLSGGFQWTIINIVDRGSLSTEGVISLP